MYIKKPSVTKIEAADRVHLLHSIICRFEQYESLKPGNCLYPYPDLPHFMIVTEKTLYFKHRIST